MYALARIKSSHTVFFERISLLVHSSTNTLNDSLPLLHNLLPRPIGSITGHSLRGGKLWWWIWCQGTQRCPYHGKCGDWSLLVCFFIVRWSYAAPSCGQSGVTTLCEMRDARLALKGHSPWKEACKGWIYLFIVSLLGLSILQVVWLIQIFVIAKKEFEAIGLVTVHGRRHVRDGSTCL